MSEQPAGPTRRMQVGVGIQTRDGDTQWHPCANRDEAWATYRTLSATMPGALLWVGAVPADEEP